MPDSITENTLLYGDNLRVLREQIPDASIDLIYLDPPFDARTSQSALFRDEGGWDDATPPGPIHTFDDVWHWNPAVEATYAALIADAASPVARIIAALRASSAARRWASSSTSS